VRLAWERPDRLGHRLSPGDGHELARQLIAAGSGKDISAATVRRILRSHTLKPGRCHCWLHPQKPRDAVFSATVSARIDLSTRPLHGHERVRSVDEQTSLPPRPRQHPTLPAQPQNLPSRCEHEYTRAGAPNRFAACETRSGKVYGPCDDRTRQQECIASLEHLDREIAAPGTSLQLVGDQVSTPQGQEVRQWVATHPRFVFHCTPVHGSWMNHVEQWFSSLQRQRCRIVDFESKDPRRATSDPCIAEWNQ
jgi:hypothetical protein